MADELYVLDGDNITHVRGAGSDYIRAREQLVGDVAGFASEAGIDVVLVFDGAGRGRQIGRVRVVHSGRETADTVIERLAHRRAGEGPASAGSVTVVSNDAVLRHVAQRGGVHAMSAREFLDRLGAAPAQRPAAPETRGRTTLGDTLDPEVRAALERMRRGQ
jgi:predicted RNA-binding protein with PIN domain